MTDIIIQELTLKYFKGIREKTITFNPKETTIKGDNRMGKTTIFDAFTWVLFGKDSLGKTTFEIKTTDEKGNTIPNVDHEVKAVLFINGRKTTLRKAWRENWVKKRGAETTTLDGHTTDCWWDEVPISMSEYQARVNQILPEEIFRLVTNPLYFNSLKDDQKRFTLLRIAGDINAQEIAAGRDAYIKILKDLDGRTIEEYNKMISAKRRQVKDELEQIGPKITYQTEIIPSSLDWKALESDKQQAEATINRLISDLSSATELSQSKAREINEHNDAIASLQAVINEAVARENKRLQDMEAEANKDYNNMKMRLSDLDLNLRRKLNALSTAREKRKDLQQSLGRLEDEKTALIDKYNQTQASEYVMMNEGIICPLYKHNCTCEIADNHRREDTGLARQTFNTNKANTLREINLAGTATAERIKACKAAIETAIQEEQIVESDYEATKVQHDTLEAEIANIKVETLDRITSDNYMNARNEKLVAECYQAQQAILQHKDAIQAIKDSNGTTEAERLRGELHAARQKADAITRNLAIREEIETGKKRLSALEAERKKTSQELADLERTELTIQQFQVEMASEIMRRINSKFKVVQFRLFDTQINGGIRETCDTLVNGVPYHSINNEARINAGIDIINVLCEIEQIQAPIWVDNRESVNILQPTASQVINLMVSTDKELIIL